MLEEENTLKIYIPETTFKNIYAMLEHKQQQTNKYNHKQRTKPSSLGIIKQSSRRKKKTQKRKRQWERVRMMAG